MKTIAQIIPALDSGGVEQAVVDIARGLVDAGYRAVVISSGGRRVSDVERAGGLHIARAVNSKNPIKIITNALWLAQLVRREKIDLLHVRSRAPAWSVLLASKISGCPFITTYHAAYKAQNSFKKFYNSAMVQGRRVIAISHYIARHIMTQYGRDQVGLWDKIRTIPRSIDTARFDPEAISPDRLASQRSTWNVGENDQVVLLPARLSPIKGHSVAIEAMAKLSDLPNLVLVIVGDDQGRAEYRQRLLQSISDLGLGQRVRLIPHCSDMPAAYAAAALVLAPSLVPEGFGRTPIEAMAMRIPVIATDLGGFSETIRHGQNGWLVPVQDVVALEKMMRDVLSIPPSNLAVMMQTASREVRNTYDLRHMVAATLAVYQEVIG